ncbi:TetR/AcrR family transcriptional regulator [Klenkia taihuensis]|uniref:Transcriptional regulator, TetR family n=1 Tax=Klenkia taihuensis TaxID=1225127 RepID=A0A1I1H3X9_9ACTN|nr:TetR/AcrR family transcriptional regulator [Klenkia taihuensis]GHE09414.1 HTH-type transcriptional regulator PksA [Klenkia taihuensis]SFC18511.1 transcriptional regulator, TetR family [Klenkia taihuensis]
MPKIVDHAERRREVLDATWRVIARAGLDAATTRAIAEEAGYSIGVLTHYFSDKQDILVSAHRLAFARARDRILVATRDSAGVTALRLAMLEALPLDDERFVEAQVDVSFLGQSVGNAYLRGIRSASYEGSRRLWRGFLDQAAAAGELAEDADLPRLVDDVVGMVDSLSIQAIVDPGHMTPDHQVLLVDRFLERIARTAR